MHLLDGSITVTKGDTSPPARRSRRSARPAARRHRTCTSRSGPTAGTRPTRRSRSTRARTSRRGPPGSASTPTAPNTQGLLTLRRRSLSAPPSLASAQAFHLAVPGPRADAGPAVHRRRRRDRQQQAQINDARADGRAVATRLGRIAHLQATLDATEDAVLREPGDGRRGGPTRARHARTRERRRAGAATAPCSAATSTRLQTLAAGDLDTRASLAPARGAARQHAHHDRTARRRDGRAHAAEAVSERADRRAQLLVIVLAFGATLMITLLVARLFISSIRRPLRTLRARPQARQRRPQPPRRARLVRRVQRRSPTPSTRWPTRCGRATTS